MKTKNPSKDAEELSTEIAEVVKAVKIPTSSHYVDNKKFLQALIDYRQSVVDAAAEGKETPIVSNYIGECFHIFY